MLVNINATHIQHPLFIIQSTLHDKIKSRPTYVFTVTLITIISSISCRQLTSVRVCVCRLSSQQELTQELFGLDQRGSGGLTLQPLLTKEMCVYDGELNI